MAQEVVWKDDWEDSDVQDWLEIVRKTKAREIFQELHILYFRYNVMSFQSSRGKIFLNDAGEEISSDEFVDELNDVVWRIFELASK